MDKVDIHYGAWIRVQDDNFQAVISVSEEEAKSQLRELFNDTGDIDESLDQFFDQIRAQVRRR